MQSRSTWLRVLVSLLSLVILFLVYDPAVVAGQVRQLWPWGFIAASLLLAVCTAVMALKWKVLLPSVPYGLLLRAITTSYLYSLLPSGQLGGEVSKLLIVRDTEHTTSHVMATIIFDKLTGLIGLLLIGVCAALVWNNPMADVFTLATGAATAALGAMLFIARTLNPRTAAPLRTAAPPRSKFLAAVGARFRGMSQSIAGMARDRGMVLRSIALGLLSQGMVVGIYLLLARSLGMDIGTIGLAAIVVVANVAALVPLSIAGLGVREAGLTVLLSQFGGVPGEQALALSLAFTCVLLMAAVVGATLEFQTLARRRNTAG